MIQTERREISGALFRRFVPRTISSPEFLQFVNGMLIFLCYPLLHRSEKGDDLMDKRVKTKVITTVICLILSVIALCVFGFCWTFPWAGGSS